MSVNEDEDLNKLMCDAEEFASTLLADGADWARVLTGNLPTANGQALSKYPIVAVGYALLVHLEHRAEEQYTQGRSFIEGLQAIKKSLDSLVVRSHSNALRNEPHPGPEQALSDYSRLKELLGLAQSAFSDANYREALTRLRRLAGV